MLEFWVGLWGAFTAWLGLMVELVVCLMVCRETARGLRRFMRKRQYMRATAVWGRRPFWGSDHE